MSLSIPFPFWVAAEQKGRVEVNILLTFLHWVRITLHSSPFVSDIAIFVLKRDVKLQLTLAPVKSRMVYLSDGGLPRLSWKEDR